MSKLLRRGPAPEPEVFRAVDGISFTVNRGESVGLVGESGCGKSTTSTMVMRLIDKTDGTIMFDGEDIGEIPAKQFAKLPMRRRIQMVFQDPTDSLNPRFTAARAIADPILRLGDIRGRDAVRARCEELALQVGLPVELLDRFPHQLSGGQKARVGIARAIALKPDLIILDEPTAALDVSVQAVVLNLLQDLKESLGMSYLFVSHDLNVVRLLCDRVIVMKAGKIVEEGPTERVLFAPEAQYTRDLLAAIPHPTFEPEQADPARGGSWVMTRRPRKAKAVRKVSRRIATPEQPIARSQNLRSRSAIRSTISSPPAPERSISRSTRRGCRRCASNLEVTLRLGALVDGLCVAGRRRAGAGVQGLSRGDGLGERLGDRTRRCERRTQRACRHRGCARAHQEPRSEAQCLHRRRRPTGRVRRPAALDQARREGQPLGPLAGVPFAVKNLFDVKGLPTLAGSKINRSHAPAAARRDADRAAGGRRRGSGRRAQHGRIRLRFHRRERARRRRRAIRTISTA